MKKLFSSLVAWLARISGIEKEIRRQQTKEIGGSIVLCSYYFSNREAYGHLYDFMKYMGQFLEENKTLSGVHLRECYDRQMREYRETLVKEYGEFVQKTGNVGYDAPYDVRIQKTAYELASLKSGHFWKDAPKEYKEAQTREMMAIAAYVVKREALGFVDGYRTGRLGFIGQWEIPHHATADMLLQVKGMLPDVSGKGTYTGIPSPEK